MCIFWFETFGKKLDLRIEAGEKYWVPVKNIQYTCGSKPILVCHGTDLTTLMNNFALVKCDEVLAESIMGSVDFFEVIDDDF